MMASLSPCARAVTGGAKAGLNISNFTGKDAKPDYGSIIQKSGFIAGGYVIIPVKDQFSFQPELMISQKGAIYKFVLDNIPSVGTLAFEEIITLTYLELPLLARYDVRSRGAAHPNIVFGPSFGIKMTARGETRSLGVTDSASLTGVKTIDPGVVLGGGVDITSGGSKITFELRYTLGLSTIYDHADGNVNIRNSVGSFLLGYQF